MLRARPRARVRRRPRDHRRHGHLAEQVELRPADPTINDHLGDAYWQSGRHVEARNQWRRALQFGPDSDEVKTIEAKLDGRVFGYAFAIGHNGGILRSGAGGLRRAAFDGGKLPFTTHTQAQTASAVAR